MMDHNLTQSVNNAIEANNITLNGDARSTSVAELRRKAQEHSAALLHSLHAVAGLSFPLHFPPISLHHALTSSNRSAKNIHFTPDFTSNDINPQNNNNNNSNNNNNNNHVGKSEAVENNNNNNINNNIIGKSETVEKIESLNNISNKKCGD
jgi:hypothetical protein